jgi:hypothetical protein
VEGRLSSSEACPDNFPALSLEGLKDLSSKEACCTCDEGSFCHYISWEVGRMTLSTQAVL